MRNSSTATIVTITRLSDDPDTSVNISDLDLPGWVFSDIMECISYAMITVAFFGIIGNSLIMVTLIKIGFSTSINISFCALCVSDFLCVAALGWNAVCFIPAFGNSDLPFKPREVVIPTGGGLSDIFCGTTAWITAFISFERCLCVVFPMKIKTIFALYALAVSLKKSVTWREKQSSPNRETVQNSSNRKSSKDTALGQDSSGHSNGFNSPRRTDNSKAFTFRDLARVSCDRRVQSVLQVCGEIDFLILVDQL
ncbi:hypothetical protein RRG08_051065 [Elysia crispata]|uniref:G-protein coupled receptors family 1 profile domain-containing protein n=1 Tax=Elysia crispata TaxID=231223 RepID=A0AAE1CWI1_9GAST|nr:hypothetical protein RRG08_051065 [Elysia crispata]